MKCVCCNGRNVFFVVAGNETVTVACKDCLHLDLRPLTPELMAEVETMMLGTALWNPTEVAEQDA